MTTTSPGSSPPPLHQLTTVCVLACSAGCGVTGKVIITFIEVLNFHFDTTSIPILLAYVIVSSRDFKQGPPPIEASLFSQDCEGTIDYENLSNKNPIECQNCGTLKISNNVSSSRVPGPGPSITACHLPCPGHKDHRVAGFLEKCAKYFTNSARDRNCSWELVWVDGVGEKKK